MEFDHDREKLAKRHLWVMLLDFPLHCWNLKGFMGISNSMGCFILIEEDQLLSLDRNMPRMLVEIDPKGGIL